MEQGGAAFFVRGQNRCASLVVLVLRIRVCACVRVCARVLVVLWQESGRERGKNGGRERERIAPGERWELPTGGTPKSGDRLLSIDGESIELMPDDEIWAKLTGDEDRQHSSKGLVKEPSRAPKSPADIHV